MGLAAGCIEYGEPAGFCVTVQGVFEGLGSHGKLGWCFEPRHVKFPLLLVLLLLCSGICCLRSCRNGGSSIFSLGRGGPRGAIPFNTVFLSLWRWRESVAGHPEICKAKRQSRRRGPDPRAPRGHYWMSGGRHLDGVWMISRW